jgi:glycosyltransferase involved in cell wall biosynthesis
VHETIIQSAAEYQPILFITERSKNQHFHDSFSQCGTLLYVGEFTKRSILKKWLVGYLTKLANSGKACVIFGGNCAFFYNLLPHYKANIRKIDLIHATSLPDWGVEQLAAENLKYLSKSITVCKQSKQALTEFYTVAKGQTAVPEIQVIYNGVESTQDCIVKEDSPFHCIWVGRDSPEKNLALFEQVAKHFQQQDSIKFTVVGVLKASYDNITFHGVERNKKVLQSLYSSAHCLLLTSHREGFPMVVLEAMQAGCVPVSTQVGGVAEIISHAQNGYLVNSSLPTNSVIEKFVEIVKQMASVPVHYQTLSEAAQETAKQFSISIMMNEYKKIWLHV